MTKIQSIEDTECRGHRLPRTQLIQDTKYPRQQPLSKNQHKNQHNNISPKTNTTTFHQKPTQQPLTKVSPTTTTHQRHRPKTNLFYQ
jgi:hypothetical protein